MIVYLSMIGWNILVGIFSRKRYETDVLTGEKELRASKLQMLAVMLYIVFFIGLRSAGADTHAYIMSFRGTATGWNAAAQALRSGFEASKSPGFDMLEVLVKTAVGNRYHVWLFLLALVSGMAVAKTLRRHTPYFTDAMLLFMLMGTYGWMINGIRQFVAVSLSFAAIDRLVQRRWRSYLIIILLLSTIHQSVLVMIPVYFIVSGEAWNRKTLLLLAAGVLAIIFTDGTVDLWDDVRATAGYSDEIYAADDGSSVIRTLIYAVPTLLSLAFRSSIRQKATPLINVCINMSVVAVVLSMIANITSGILVGRMPIYFSIYNLILLPWLLRNIPTWFRKPTYCMMYLCYAALSFIEGYGFYYSDILFGGRLIE